MKPKLERAAPASANEVLANTRDDHNWNRADEDLTSTGGIQRAIRAQWHAIQALADYIDGVATGMTNDDGVPIKIRSAADTPPAESPPDAYRDPAFPVPVV